MKSVSKYDWEFGVFGFGYDSQPGSLSPHRIPLESISVKRHVAQVQQEKLSMRFLTSKTHTRYFTGSLIEGTKTETTNPTLISPASDTCPQPQPLLCIKTPSPSNKIQSHSSNPFALFFLQVSSDTAVCLKQRKVFERNSHPETMKRRREIAFADFTTDDIEAADVLLMLHSPRVFFKVDSRCGFPSWAVKRRRSFGRSMQSFLVVRPGITGSGGVGPKCEAEGPPAAKAEALSPATPLSFPPSSESDEKPKQDQKRKFPLKRVFLSFLINFLDEIQFALCFNYWVLC